MPRVLRRRDDTLRAEVGRGRRRFDGVLSADRTPGCRPFLRHAVRERSGHRVRDRQRCHRPLLRGRPQCRCLHDVVSGSDQRAESLAIERYHPSLILWGSTDERSSIVVNTAHGTKVLVSGSPEWKTVMLQRMDTRVNQFLATGARVVLTLAPPSVHPAEHTVDSDDEDYAHMNSLLKEVAAKHPHQVAVVDLSRRVCPTGPPCQAIVPAFNPNPTSITQTVRADGIHYLPNASLWVARWLGASDFPGNKRSLLMGWRRGSRK